MIRCFQLCGNRLGKALSYFRMTMPLCTKWGPYRNGLSKFVWKNLTGPHSPDLNSIEHLWDELERWLRARHNRPTSVPNLTNALVAEWKQVPAAMFQHLVESQKSGGYYSRKGGTNSILMPMILKWQVSKYIWSCSVCVFVCVYVFFVCVWVCVGKE